MTNKRNGRIEMHITCKELLKGDNNPNDKYVYQKDEF